MYTSTTSVPSAAQVRAWAAEGKRRYPDFDLILQFRHARDGWQYSLHLEPLHAADWSPAANYCRPTWYSLETFWREDGQSELDVLFSLHPDQASLPAGGSTTRKPEAHPDSPLKAIWHFLMLASG